jgi:hypothetical protein
MSDVSNTATSEDDDYKFAITFAHATQLAMRCFDTEWAPLYAYWAAAQHELAVAQQNANSHDVGIYHSYHQEPRRIRGILDAIEQEGRTLFFEALKCGRVRRFAHTYEEDDRRIPIDEGYPLDVFYPHEGRSLPICIFKEDFDAWMAESKAERQRVPNGNGTARPRKFSKAAAVTIKLLRKEFKATHGDPGEGYVISALARQLKPLMDLELPACADLNGYEGRIKTAVDLIRAGVVDL